MENVDLENKWTIYFHDFMNSNWSRESYERLVQVSNVIDFWTVFNIMKDELSLGMFFFMKNNFFPKWDDNDDNKMSYLSIKILKTNTAAFMEQMLVQALTEQLCPSNPELINGISISPKKNFCICKVWINSIDDKFKDLKLYNVPDDYYGDILVSNF